MNIVSGDAITSVAQRYTVTVAESASAPSEADTNVHADWACVTGVTTPLALTVAMVSSAELQLTVASVMRWFFVS